MIEIAVVGPETRCLEEPNSAAIMGGMMAAYSPYWAGSPAIMAKETPWGKTIKAPVSPAIMSARRDARLIRLSHARNGKSCIPAGIGRTGAAFLKTLFIQ